MIRLLVGHVLDKLAEIPNESTHCCVTSPPYYGLRDYSIEPQVWDGEAECDHDFQIKGSGTTLLVADQLQRNAIGIELNPTYANMAANRAANDAPLFTTVLTDNILQPQLL